MGIYWLTFNYNKVQQWILEWGGIPEKHTVAYQADLPMTFMSVDFQW